MITVRGHGVKRQLLPLSSFNEISYATKQVDI